MGHFSEKVKFLNFNILPGKQIAKGSWYQGNETQNKYLVLDCCPCRRKYYIIFHFYGLQYIPLALCRGNCGT